MPSRWLSLAIVVFWLSTTSWLFWTDLWPQLRPGQPPPITIDLIQEAGTKRPFIHWTVLQNDRPVFQAKTRTERLGPDNFELSAEYKRLMGQSPATILGAEVKHMRSAYRVSVNGGLRGLSITAEGALPPLLRGGGNVTLAIEGEVKDGAPGPALAHRVAGQQVQPGQDVPVRGGRQKGLGIAPLHPADRLRDLRPGQSWRVPVFDPLADSLAQLTPLGLGSEPRLLDARVASEPQLLGHGPVGRRRDASCLVIDYESKDMKARTWVEEITGRVLRQEAEMGGDRWVMQRD